MKTKYYKMFAEECNENPSHWFSGMERKDIPVGYRGGVQRNAENWDLWQPLCAAVWDAAEGNQRLRRWVRTQFEVPDYDNI